MQHLRERLGGFTLLVCFRSRKSTSQPKPPKKQTNSSRKKFFIFWIMELSSFNIKKNIIFPEIKHCTFRTQPSKFFPKKTRSEKISHIFLYFPKWNPGLFSLSSISKKIHPGKISYTSRNRNLEKFFFFQETELSYILGNESFLYFRKQNFLIFQIGIFRTLAYLELHSNLSIVDTCGF